jgi:hypothetical protein
MPPPILIEFIYFLSLWERTEHAYIMLFVHIIHDIAPPLTSWLSHFDKNDNLIFVLTRVIKFCYRWHARSWQLASPLEVELPTTSSLHVHVWGTFLGEFRMLTLLWRVLSFVGYPDGMEPRYFWRNDQLGEGLLVTIEVVVRPRGDTSEWID